MSIIRVPLNEANREQLLHFANVHMGLQLPPASNKTTVLAKIKAVWTNTYINVDEEALKNSTADADPKELASNPALSSVDDEVVEVMIPMEDKPGGREPVPVSVNGVPLWIPRAENVFIPIRFYHALMNAEKTLHHQERIDVNNEITKSKAISYPVQLIGRNKTRKQYEDQVAAMRQRTKAA